MKKRYFVGGIIISILAGVMIGQSQGFVLANQEPDEIKIINDMDEEFAGDIPIGEEEADLEDQRLEDVQPVEKLEEDKREEEVLTGNLSEKQVFERKMELAREDINQAVKNKNLTESQAKEELDYIDYLEENYGEEIGPRYDGDSNYYNDRAYGHHRGSQHRDGSCRDINGGLGDNYRGHHNGACRRY